MCHFARQAIKLNTGTREVACFICTAIQISHHLAGVWDFWLSDLSVISQLPKLGNLPKLLIDFQPQEGRVTEITFKHPGHRNTRADLPAHFSIRQAVVSTSKLCKPWLCVEHWVSNNISLNLLSNSMIEMLSLSPFYRSGNRILRVKKRYYSILILPFKANFLCRVFILAASKFSPSILSQTHSYQIFTSTIPSRQLLSRSSMISTLPKPMANS